MTDKSGTAKTSVRGWLFQPPRRHGEVITDRTVSFLELFYDLVFVVLVSQIAHTLIGHVTWAGVGDFVIVFCLVWIAWINGALFHELHGREDGRSRIAIFAQMIVLSILALYATHATDVDGPAFAICYTVLLFLLTLQWNSVRRIDTPEYRRLAGRYVGGMVASVVIIGGSAFASHDVRNALWAVYALGWLGMYVVVVAIAGRGFRGVAATESLIERFGLFTIIVLGEVVVGVVTGMSDAGRDRLTITTGALGLCIGFGLWWTYFDFVGRRLPKNDGRNLTVYVLSHLPLTMAIAASGAAVANLVEHSGDGHTPAAISWLLATCVAVMLLSLAVTIASLEDRRRKPLLFNAVMRMLIIAAIASLLIGWAHPAPWILVLLLVFTLVAVWTYAFNRKLASER